MSLPHPPPPTDEPDSSSESPIPEPPRRVPFAVSLVTALLGLVALLAGFLSVAALISANTSDSLGRAAAGGLLVSLLAVCAAVAGAVAWSFPRNGNQLGTLVIGGVVALAGLISLACGVLSETNTNPVVLGTLGVVLGLMIALGPLVGDAPGYLAARRVWARAERDWLRQLTTAAVPPPVVWPGAHPGQPWQPQQPWPQQPTPPPSGGPPQQP